MAFTKGKFSNASRRTLVLHDKDNKPVTIRPGEQTKDAIEIDKDNPVVQSLLDNGDLVKGDLKKSDDQQSGSTGESGGG